ncbi:MAG: hypothetical protein KAQ94_08385 [Arcobacteraceae bacterium]|nr:hypothetical protein [Arcobacteraceae bacterium]
MFAKKSDIICAVVDGIKIARYNYTSWTSNKLQLSDTSEDFLIIHIAQEIAKLKDAPEIFIDATITDILKCSLKTKNKYKQFMQQNLLSQDTICLTLDEKFEHLNGDDSISHAIIDIKNNVRNNKKEYQDNIEKLCKMLQRQNSDDSSLDFAIFAFYFDISSGARISAEQRIKNIISSFDTIVKKYNHLKSNFIGGDIEEIENIGQYSIGCFVIEPSKAK